MNTSKETEGLVNRMANMGKQELATLLLRVGLGFGFLYAGIAGLVQPDDWAGFVPDFVKAVDPAQFSVTAFSVFQVIIALWLLSGKRIFYAAIAASLSMLAITITNLDVFLIVFRDVVIFFAAMALAALSKGD